MKLEKTNDYYRIEIKRVSRTRKEGTGESQLKVLESKSFSVYETTMEELFSVTQDAVVNYNKAKERAAKKKK